MFLTEYSQKLILKYFVNAVGEFQNKRLEFDIGFHGFGTLIKITRHQTAAPGAKVFVYITYRQFVYMW